MEIRKTGKHCTNCGQDNHNVEMCKVKNKKEPTIATMEATIQFKRFRRIIHICMPYLWSKWA